MNTQTKRFNILYKSLIYMLGGETANHVNFMQSMLISYSSCYFSSLEGHIEKCQSINL